jgi:hypothetical protein
MPDDSTYRTSSSLEQTSGINVENEARKTADSSWDSPFHTLGKGATQAAPGTHRHDAGDITGIEHDHSGVYAPVSHNHDHGALTGRGDDDHMQYVLANGGRAMTGDLRITKSTPRLQLYHGGVGAVSLGINGLKMACRNEQNSALTQLQVANPTADDDAANIRWARQSLSPRVSGPHKVWDGYIDITAIAPNWTFKWPGIACFGQTDPGWWHVTAMAYLDVTGGDTSEQGVIFGVDCGHWGERADGNVNWSNGHAVQVGRLTAPAGARTVVTCLLYTSPSPRDRQKSRMPSSA